MNGIKGCKRSQNSQISPVNSSRSSKERKQDGITPSNKDWVILEENGTKRQDYSDLGSDEEELFENASASQKTQHSSS